MIYDLCFFQSILEVQILKGHLDTKRHYKVNESFLEY